MAEEHLTPKAKQKITQITDHLKTLDRYSKFLDTLAGHQEALEEKTVNLSLDTIEAIASAMSMAVDAISAELGLDRYEGRPEADAYVLKTPSPAANPTEAH
ncbi:MAG: hypothetical protein C4567_07600 [Deltaproteobacteria bacterium]|nr:MAG: hypothetical protein C4567_07600 [Deltaproteobacteria bacterium]